MLFLLITGVNQGWAQNVTISPQNGSMICALTAGSQQTQLGFQIGAFGTWRHNQLSLTMTGSNYTTLTEDGQLSQHSNHFITGDKCTFSPADDTRIPSRYIVADWGGDALKTGYITIALPKGYRFTSYTFHLSHDVSKFGQNNTAFNLTTDTRVFMTETNSDFSGNLNRVKLAGNSKDVVEFTRTGDDMGNILYFTTSADYAGFYAMTFRYIELRFTADADAPINLLPSTQTTTGHSMMEIPFNTGKVDLGEIKQGTYQGAKRVSYQYNTVSDMSANMLLYEFESTKKGTALDGTSGLVAYDKGGSITTNGNYFQFAPVKTEEKDEQIYFVETPVSARMSNNVDNPVQFRITSARINYTKSQTNPFYIQYTDNGTTYYLRTNGQFSSSYRTQWEMDGDGHIYSGSSYLTGTDSYVDVTESKSAATTFTISGTTIINARGNTLKHIYIGGNRYGYFTNSETLYDRWGNSYNVYPAELKYVEGTGVSNFTIYIYDKEGNRDSRYPDGITVTKTGYVDLPDLNNDAIKFGVKGGDVALLNFEMKLQALNPYIDNMTVVLSDTYKDKNIRQTRTFTADDFSVGGDTFKFYLPKDCIHDPLTITFEDLYSKYGDDTYDHTNKPGTSNSRYNFVKSQHHQKFTNDNIYNGKAEAASGTLESQRIEDDENIRTKVGIVGNQAFRFNNADELADHDGYLTEYPFTLDKYAKQTKPGKGEFVVAGFNKDVIDDQDWEKQTFYVFTTDETRYNIAPTTATQHRFYAFYKMVVQVLCDDYEPSIEFIPIYEKTLTDNGTSQPDESPYFGVKVTGPKDKVVDSPLASDVATYKAISKAVEKGDDVNIPKTLKQILYVDLSALNGVYHSNGTGVDEDDEEDAGKDYSLASFDKLRWKLAPNALIFLPANSTDRYDNFAYAKKGEVAGSFQSANNIILTDKSPFYTPYTIQVDAANHATYKRLQTASSESLVQKATVVLPFTMKVENGKHKNDTEDGFEFNLRELKKLKIEDGLYDSYGTTSEANGYFELITGDWTIANRPYMVEVTNGNGADYSFIAAQKGSNIIATKDATLTGETANVTGSGTVTNTGSYSGAKIPKANKVFYFNKNKYVNSENLQGYNDVYLQPFRAYYATSGVTPSKINMFNIIYDELEEDEGLITDITNARARGPLTVTTGKGFMSLTSGEDISVTVYNTQGTMIANLMLKAGDRQDINVPAGVYVVNKNKVIVK